MWEAQEHIQPAGWARLSQKFRAFRLTIHELHFDQYNTGTGRKFLHLSDPRGMVLKYTFMKLNKQLVAVLIFDSFHVLLLLALIPCFSSLGSYTPNSWIIHKSWSQALLSGTPILRHNPVITKYSEKHNRKYKIKCLNKNVRW